MNNKKVPNLRFPEFSGEWYKKGIANICSINPKSKEIPNEFYYIDLESVVKGSLVNNIFLNKAGAPSRAQRVLEKYDVLFQMVRPYQKNNYIYNAEKDFPTVASTGYAQLRSNQDSNFLYQLINTSRFNNEVLIRCTGSSYPAINSSDLSEIDVNICSVEEQEKIAKFFTLIDAKIEKQSQKVQELKNYKKGIMQKIFSQEIRFKKENGEEYPGWEEKLLGDLLKISTGKKDTQDKIEDGVYPFFVRSQQIERINSYSFDGEAILTAGDGVGVGKVFHYINGKFDYHQRVYKLSDFSHGVHGRYIFEYFRVNFLREVTKYTAKTSVDSVRMEMLTKMKTPLPILEEQVKIAQFLSTIDKKLEKEQEKLDSLNTWKKGLLQQMFV